MSFGESLKRVRLELGWTQPELAEAICEASGGTIKLTPAEISRYECGRVRSPRLEVLLAVAKATVRPIEFFTGSPQKEVGLPEADTFPGARRGHGEEGRTARDGAGSC